MGTMQDFSSISMYSVAPPGCLIPLCWQIISVYFSDGFTTFFPLYLPSWLFVCLFIQLRTAALRLIVRCSLDVPTFATRRLHVCHHARAPSGGMWNCGREMSGNFT